MDNLKLDKRLGACAEFVRNDSVLCDIGTDHAYLPTYLLLNEKIKFALACDINQNPLNSAKSTVTEHGVADRVSLRLCDGLKGVKSDEFSDLVVAGMGGETIISVIDNAEYLKDDKYRLILQPMTKTELLRKYLNENKYKIADEKSVSVNGKIYSVICAVYSKDVEQKDDLYFYIGELQDKFDEESILYKQKIKRSLEKQANSILAVYKDNKKALDLQKIIERIKV